MVQRRDPKTVYELLAQARATLPGRPAPAEALHAHAGGALLIDIRGDDQRREDGLIRGAIMLSRYSNIWLAARIDPASAAQAADAIAACVRSWQRAPDGPGNLSC